MKTQLSKLGLIALPILFCLMTGCDIKAGGWVYVDNGSDETIVVEMDGVQVLEIAPGEFDRIAAATGDREFIVTGGEKVVFEGTKTIEEPNGFLNPHRYLFNPDGINRYWTYKVYYASEKAVRHNGRVSDAESHVVAHESLCEEFEVLPVSDWLSIPGRPYILQDAPDQLVLDDDKSIEVETVLSRTTTANYAILKNAPENS